MFNKYKKTFLARLKNGDVTITGKDKDTYYGIIKPEGYRVEIDTFGSKLIGYADILKIRNFGFYDTLIEFNVGYFTLRKIDKLYRETLAKEGKTKNEAEELREKFLSSV